MPVAAQFPVPDPLAVAARVECCLPMARLLARRARLGPGFGRDDAWAAALYGLYQAAARFADSPGRDFATYAAARIRGSIVDDRRRASGRRGERKRLPAPLELTPGRVPSAPDPRPDDPDEAAAILARLGASDRAALTRRFGLDGAGGRNYRELARDWGCSTSWAYRRVSRSLSRARAAANPP